MKVVVGLFCFVCCCFGRWHYLWVRGFRSLINRVVNWEPDRLGFETSLCHLLSMSPYSKQHLIRLMCEAPEFICVMGLEQWLAHAFSLKLLLPHLCFYPLPECWTNWGISQNYKVYLKQEGLCWRTSWCWRLWLISEVIRFPKTESGNETHFSPFHSQSYVSATVTVFMAKKFKAWRDGEEQESREIPKDKGKWRSYTPDSVVCFQCPKSSKSLQQC